MFGFRPLFRVFTLYEAYGRTKLPNSDLQHFNIICPAIALLSDFLRIFGFAEDPLVRQIANTFAFALAYSYLCVSTKT